MTENISKKDWLYIAGAVASLVAIAVFAASRKVVLPDNTVSGAVSDVASNANNASPTGFSPGYTGYNMGPIYPTALIPPEELQAGPAGSCSCNSQGCAGVGAGNSATGDLTQYLNYLKETDPNYLALQQAQLQVYAESFAAGSVYTKGVAQISPFGAH